MSPIEADSIPRSWRAVFVAALFCVFGSLFPTANSGRANDPNQPARATAAGITAHATRLEREQSVALLVGRGEESSSVVDALLRSPTVLQRAAGLEVLISQEQPAHRFYPFLKDPAYTIRALALEGLRNAFAALDGHDLLVSHPIDPLRPLLRDRFWQVRRAAGLACIASRNPEGAIPVLELLDDAEPEVRRAILFALRDLNAELHTADLEEISRRLSPPELDIFLKNSVPLARPANAAFFRDMADRQGCSTAGLWALAALTSVNPAESDGPRIWCELPRLVDISLNRSGETEAAADTVIGWVAIQHPARWSSLLHRLMVEGRHNPGQIVQLLWATLEQDAVPILEAWSLQHLDEADIMAPCLDYLDTGVTRAGAVALAKLIPLLRGPLRHQAVKKAAKFLENEAHEELIEVLSGVLHGDSTEVAAAAYRALCRLDPPPPDVIQGLIQRFQREQAREMRVSMVRHLAMAASRGAQRERVVAVLRAEVEGARPAAIPAASLLPGLVTADEKTAVAEALVAFLGRASNVDDRENLLFVLTQLDSPLIDPFLAAEIDAMRQAAGDAQIGRLIRGLGDCRGAATGELLLRCAAAPERTLEKEALRALIERRDPRAVALLEELFPVFNTSARQAFLADLARNGLGGVATPFLMETVRNGRDSDLVAGAITALPKESMLELEAELIALCSEPERAGTRAAEAALWALGACGDDRALHFLGQTLEAFLEQARAADVVFFDQTPDSVALGLATARVLAERRVPCALPLLAGLLLQRSRATRDSAILESWEAEAGQGSKTEHHDWLRQVLDCLLCYPDEAIEAALLAELECLAAEGTLYQMGDAPFAVAFYELAARNRCPRLQRRLSDLVFRCRPVRSPAEFRMAILMGDRAAANERRAEAARSYFRAYSIARYDPPARRVIRKMLPLPEPLKGYDPQASLFSEACSLFAGAAARDGRLDDAAELNRMARSMSPFRRLPEVPTGNEPEKAQIEEGY